MEQLDFTVAKHYRITKIVLDWQGSTIEVHLKDDQDTPSVVTYAGATATNLMIILNTANLSVKSLHKRVIEKLMLDGKLPSGDITGSP